MWKSSKDHKEMTKANLPERWLYEEHLYLLGDYGSWGHLFGTEAWHIGGQASICLPVSL
jgi:hypothetical protein